MKARWGLCDMCLRPDCDTRHEHDKSRLSCVPWNWMLSEMWGLKAARGKWGENNTVATRMVLAVSHVSHENESEIIKIQGEYKKHAKIIVSMCRTWACSSLLLQIFIFVGTLVISASANIMQSIGSLTHFLTSLIHLSTVSYSSYSFTLLWLILSY